MVTDWLWKLIFLANSLEKKVATVVSIKHSIKFTTCYVIALNPDLLYCIFEFLICLPSRKERGLQGIFVAVVI